MAAAPTVWMQAGSHERAGCVGRRVKIQYGGHAVALDGEGQEVSTKWQYQKSPSQTGPQNSYAVSLIVDATGFRDRALTELVKAE